MESIFHTSFARALLAGVSCHCSPEVQKKCLDHCASFHYKYAVGKDGLEQCAVECSSIFIGKLFSLVLQREVKAAVACSFLRDGKTCIYEVTL